MQATPSGTAPGSAGAEMPLWLGSPGRPLAARLHMPADHRVRGCVVLCPAVGYEYALAHASIRLLAQDLAAAGVAALRLDYDGVGDSWGDDLDPGRVPAWAGSIVTAVEEMRRWGGTDVALVGLRLGATLAASAASAVDASALALWDPVVAGRRYVRRLRAMATMQGRRAAPGSITADGSIFTEETLGALSRLSLPGPDHDRPVLAVLREDAEVPPGLSGATVVHRPGQHELFASDTLDAQPPLATLAELTRWLSARLPAEPTTTLTVAARGSAAVDGIRETFVVHADMAGVVSEPTGSAAPPRPTVLLVNTSVDPHIGPSRAWVDWSRQLASHGIRSLRADLSGIGDSPPRPGTLPQLPYGPNTVSDVRALIDAADIGSGVALVGLCSGARNAMDAAGGRPVADLLLVNPVITIGRDRLEQLGPAERHPKTAPPLGLGRRIRHHIAGRLPGPAWWAVHRIGLLASRTRALHQSIQAGTEVLFVYSADDYVMLQPAQNSRWALAELHASGRFTVHEIEADHALFDPIGRRDVLMTMTRHLLGRYPDESGPVLPRPREDSARAAG